MDNRTALPFGAVDKWSTDPRVRGWLNIGPGHTPRNAALLLLYELGEAAATPEVLNLLERRFRTADLANANAIAMILCRMGTAGEDRQRDILMRLCLDPCQSFLAPHLPGSGQGALHALRPKSEPDIRMFEREAAWERLDPEGAADWLSRIVPVLIRFPRRAYARLEQWTVNPQPSVDELEVVAFGVLERCLRRAPEAFERIHKVFTADCKPGVCFKVVGLLTKPQASLPRSPLTLGRAGTDAAEFSTCLIHKIPAASRQFGDRPIAGTHPRPGAQGG